MERNLPQLIPCFHDFDSRKVSHLPRSDPRVPSFLFLPGDVIAAARGSIMIFNPDNMSCAWGQNEAGPAWLVTSARHVGKLIWLVR